MVVGQQGVILAFAKQILYNTKSNKQRRHIKISFFSPFKHVIQSAKSHFVIDMHSDDARSDLK